MEYDPQPPFDSGSLAKATPETVALTVKLLTAAIVESGAPPELAAMVAQANS